MATGRMLGTGEIGIPRSGYVRIGSHGDGAARRGSLIRLDCVPSCEDWLAQSPG